MSRDSEPLKKYRFEFELDAFQADKFGSMLTDTVRDALANAIDPKFTAAEREWFERHAEWLDTIKSTVLAGMNETSELVNTPP